ncbi:MAG: hypothetical protein RL616_1105 [Verrucomicrobiota bacterium]
MMPTDKLRRQLWLLVLAAFALYALLPTVAAGLSSAEPAFTSRLFGWLNPFASATGRQTHSHLHASAWFAIVCAALFGIYFYALKLTRGGDDARAQKIIFLGGAAFLLVQIFSSVMLSSDVFAYALYGRVASVYHANPYDLAPPVAGNDPFLRLFGQEYLPSWYGPVWTLLSAVITKLGGANVALTVLLFRLTSSLTALACAWLILVSLRRHAPERATQGLVFFLWNPLLILETSISGHNDSVMLVFVLLAVWLHLRGWKTAAVVALTLSALVKFLTGMLIPLYVLLVLRELGPAELKSVSVIQFLRGLFTVNLKPKLFFLARTAVAVGLVCFTANALTKSNSTASAPVSQQAIAPDFYANNFHELIFKGLRRALGEDADSVSNPIYFQGWWLAATNQTSLLARPDAKSDRRATLAAAAQIIVIAPQTDDDWARAYDPVSKQRGFVWSPYFADAERPANADNLAKLFDTMTAERPPVVLANNLLRAALWLAFAAFGLLCAWRTNSFEEFLVWSAAALLASYFLIITEIWPWYANWAVAVGALASNRAPARLAAILSACVLTLYVTLGFQGSDQNWIYELRSLPAFMLPLLIWFVLNSGRAKSHATR